MSRPVRIPIDDGLNDWDALINDDLTILFDAPIPLPQPAGLTESNLQATYPAASFDRCVVWANHSVVGYTLYWSDGTAWVPVQGIRSPKTQLTATTTQVRADVFVRFTGAGSVDYDFLTASAWAGRTVTIRNDASAAIMLDPNASELINGVSGSLSLGVGLTAVVYSDGTELFAYIS